jgi:hypothetical protein
MISQDVHVLHVHMRKEQHLAMRLRCSARDIGVSLRSELTPCIL